ncbi:MAG: gliding motility protein GldL [Bacteroidetes bacterium]|nr:gliding motility protein GldL [Bacteroidota bacterium]
MSFFKSKKFKYFQNLIFGVGAAIVMIGAASKITHQSILGVDGNLWILIGLGTEAILFAMSGIVPPHEDYYWQKLYPGLDEYDGVVAGMDPGKKHEFTATLDDMLEQSKLEQETINRLGDNLKSLGENVSHLSTTADASVATEAYAKSATQAAEALNGVKSSYSSASEAMGKLAAASESTSQYHEQVQMVTKNLAALNAVYEIELQDTNTHLKQMNKFYDNLSSALGHLEGSMDDAQRYKDNMSKLAGNLERLNGVYGNMLNAMKG